MKLVNAGHAQSEETRMKIGAGIRKGWQRRREMLLVQETCCLEWKGVIAEASRKGYGSDEELHWDSYKSLDEQLTKEWLESIEMRKSIPRPKGQKRAPKSPEQRKKISEAIFAKWADPGYRDRVCSGLAKYHGIPPGTERRRRRKPVNESQSAERKTVKKKTAELKHVDEAAKLVKKVTKKRKTATPSYKDPMANFKLEMIKKIRVQRATMEARKREATKRAKLLIAEAEKAAKALELAALKSPIARDSLFETRKLIAEAARSIERIESGQLASQESVDETSLRMVKPVNHSQSEPEAFIADTCANGRQVNSTPLLSSNQRKDDGFDFVDFSEQNSLNGRQTFSVVNGTEISSRSFLVMDQSPCLSDSARKHSDVRVPHFTPNGSFKGDLPPTSADQGLLQAGRIDDSVTLTKTKKRWVRGRLVEVEKD